MPGNLFSASGNCGPVAHVARRTKRRGGVLGKQAGRQATHMQVILLDRRSPFQTCLSRISVGMPSSPGDIAYSRYIPLACMPRLLVVNGFIDQFTCWEGFGAKKFRDVL